MRVLWVLPILLCFGPINQNSSSTSDLAPVAILGFDWSRARQAPDAQSSSSTTPVIPVTQTRNFEQQRRAQAPAGERDPYEDTVERRSAALDRVVQESRAPQPVDGFSYHLKLQSASTKTIRTVLWDYSFTELANPANVSHRTFLCGMKLKPNQAKDVRVFSTLGPSNVVSVDTLAKKAESPFSEIVLINFIEYTDGTYWQRKDWNANAVKVAYGVQSFSDLTREKVCRGL
jgi:hypothetical protein